MLRSAPPGACKRPQSRDPMTPFGTLTPLLMAVTLSFASAARAEDAPVPPQPAPHPATGFVDRVARTDTSAIPTTDSLVAQRRAVMGNYQHLLDQADSALKARGGSHAENAQLFLSWGAPWGMPGARSALTPACADTAAIDTLYLAFYPGRESRQFTGFSAVLDFHSVSADTLGSWWHMESKGGENGGNLQVEFGPSATIPGRQAWTKGGQGFSLLERTPTNMRMRVLFAVSLDQAGPIEATASYTLCRVLVRHRRAGRLAGCGQPVCVELASAKLGFALKDEPEVRRGERFVTYGSGARGCEPLRGPRPPAWQPRK